MEDSDAPSPAPPRAFTQGVGTVFQYVGVLLFLTSMSVCCISSFFTKERASRAELSRVGWHLAGEVSYRRTAGGSNDKYVVVGEGLERRDEKLLGVGRDGSLSDQNHWPGGASYVFPPRRRNEVGGCFGQNGAGAG